MLSHKVDNHAYTRATILHLHIAHDAPNTLSPTAGSTRPAPTPVPSGSSNLRDWDSPTELVVHLRVKQDRKEGMTAIRRLAVYMVCMRVCEEQILVL